MQFLIVGDFEKFFLNRSIAKSNQQKIQNNLRSDFNL